MGWLRYIRPVPDVDEESPRIKKIGSTARDLGEKFAAWTRLDRFAAWAQRQTDKDPRRAGIVLICVCALLLGVNACRVGVGVAARSRPAPTATVSPAAMEARIDSIVANMRPSTPPQANDPKE